MESYQFSGFEECNEIESDSYIFEEFPIDELDDVCSSIGGDDAEYASEISDTHYTDALIEFNADYENEVQQDEIPGESEKVPESVLTNVQEAHMHLVEVHIPEATGKSQQEGIGIGIGWQEDTGADQQEDTGTDRQEDAGTDRQEDASADRQEDASAD